MYNTNYNRNYNRRPCRHGVPRKRSNSSIYLITTAIILVIAITIAITCVVTSFADTDASEVTETAIITETITEEVEDVEEPTAATVEPHIVIVEESCKKSLGEFLITYYCACSKCCDEYGINRPVVNGKTIVFTATMAVAQEGVTIAVDPEVIPYGSTVYIEGVGYRVAQDCGGAIKGNRIDVYINSHERANEIGIHTSEVYLMTDIEETVRG